MKSLPSVLNLLGRLRPIVAVCLAATLGSGVAHGAPRTLKFAFILPMESQLGAGAKVFATEVAARTGGRFAIDLYPNAMLGGEVAVLDALKADAIDVGFVTGAPLPTVVPDMGVFNIPFLFEDAAAARRLLDGPIGDAYLRKFDAAGLHALAWGENGMRQLTNSKRPVHTPADLRGLKLRLPQSEVMIAGFRALGAEPAPIPFPQVYAALRSGRVDAQENPIATIVASRFYEVQKNLTLTSHAYDPAVILMSGDDWNELSAEDQAAFNAAARAASVASRDFASKAETTGLATMRAAGVAIVETIDRAAFAEQAAKADPIYDQQFGRATIERIKAYQAPAGSVGRGALP